jgi:L-ascorbate metabolism protein UlaG (beta-lactamase superfamily)
MASVTVGTVLVNLLGHASVKLQKGKTVYIDPFSEVMERHEEQADLIICTHSHFDHFDIDAIDRLIKDDTIVLAHKSCDISEIKCEARLIEVGDTERAHGILVTGIEAYNDHRFRNPNEPFHPPGQGMGVIVKMDHTQIYHAGDTDYIDEMDALRIEELDAALLPIGGTYTMDVDEAVDAAKTIQPDVAIPIHHNVVEGTEADPAQFKRQLEQQTDIGVHLL